MDEGTEINKQKQTLPTLNCIPHIHQRPTDRSWPIQCRMDNDHTQMYEKGIYTTINLYYNIIHVQDLWIDT